MSSEITRGFNRHLRLKETLIALGSFLLFSPSSLADVGVIVQDALPHARLLLDGGHAAVYLSNVCRDEQERSLRFRLCGPGEEGIVLGRYMRMSRQKKFDFFPLSFSRYFFGVKSQSARPWVATAHIRALLIQETYSEDVAGFLDNDPAEVERWKMNVAGSFQRHSFLYSVETTPTEDLHLIEMLNQHLHSGGFNLVRNNCAHMALRIVAIVFPELREEVRKQDLFTSTPLGVALAFQGLAATRRPTQITFIPQIPGTYWRSGPVNNGKALLLNGGIVTTAIAVGSGPAAALGLLGILIKKNPDPFDSDWSEHSDQARGSCCASGAGSTSIFTRDSNHRHDHVESIFHELDGRIRPIVDDLAARGVLSEEEASRARKADSLLNFLDERSSYRMSEGAVECTYDGGSFSLAHDGLGASSTKGAFLFAVARWQKETEWAARQSRRHKPSIEALRTDFDTILRIYQNILEHDRTGTK